MKGNLLKTKLFKEKDYKDNNPVELNGLNKIKSYPLSIEEYNDAVIFVGYKNKGKFLYIAASSNDKELQDKFEGEYIDSKELGDNIKLKECPLNHHNVLAIQKIFPFTCAVPLGLTDSFGFGDRLGLANAGHIRSLKGHKFRPIFAQQSIRELTRTNRVPEEVMDAAVWAVYQEGYKGGFGADADHLKTTDDIDLMMKAGYKTFTFDPSDYVVNGVEAMSEADIMKKIETINWGDLNDTSSGLLSRYVDKKIKVDDDFVIEANKLEVLRSVLKYTSALAHIKKLYDYMKNKYSGNTYEIEVSIDETDTVTSPFEHFFIVDELIRLGVKFISLAPRFIGEFEKGIDYKGDLGIFKSEYEKHAKIAKHFGTYKISLHSGSDKFSAYRVIGFLDLCRTHVKTAGTSYLEALKVVAIKEPDLFREILDFSAGLYETEKKTYHVSADLKKIKHAKDYKDVELEGLFASNDIRQVLHVTYGRVLTEKNAQGKYIFRDKIYKCLIENEDLHYKLLIAHFHRHLEPFDK
jgi:hypothetical protein